MEGLRKVLEEIADEAGLGQPTSLETYRPEEMYKAIDGEADLFLSYDCRGLAMARYQAGDAMIEAEVFDQGEPLNAFGVYSQLRRKTMPSLDIGAEGVRLDNEAIFFWKSRYFMRVAAISAKPLEDKVLPRLSQGIADRLHGSSRLPGWTAALPVPEDDGRALQYVRENVLGHAFLSHAMISEHHLGDGACRFVLVRAEDEQQAEAQWERLKTWYQGSDADSTADQLGSKAFSGVDRQKRPVLAVRSGRHVVITLGECQTSEARVLLAETLRRLENAR